MPPTTDPNQIPWWTLRFEAIAEIDPLLLGTLEGPAEAEVDFILQLTQLRKGDHVLDVACGTGLHAHLLHGKGMSVTGVDLSPRLLRVAREGGAGPTWMPGDMRWLPRTGPFDVALLLGPSFGFFEDDEDHRRTLTSLADLLKSNGKLVCNLFNPYPWASRTHTQHVPPEVDGADVDVVKNWRFDAMRGRVEERTLVLGHELRRELPTASIRAWTPAEIIPLFRSAGFRKVSVFGSEGWAVPEEPIPVHPQDSLFLWVLAEL